MRRLLYISPYFPPVAKVGSLRPLKFARHLPAQGWTPILLTDVHPTDPLDPGVLGHVPTGLQVHRDYGRHGAAAWHRYLDGGPEAVPLRDGPWQARMRSVLPRALRNEDRSPSFWWPAQEVVPLGHHALEIPHAVAAAHRVLDSTPCDAVMVNSEPHAALFVGELVARERGLPFIMDLRDPWSVCELKRPRRPAPQRALVDRMERWLVERAACVILNTETTLADYRSHYADLPAERFTCIRNHGDAALISSGSWPPRPRFSMVFLGNFRPFVEGDILLEALARLPALGVALDDVELLVTGRVPAATRAHAASLGVSDALVDHPFVPYPEVGTFLATTDLAISLNNATRQRIPAKFYDYAVTDRPMLVIADNPELVALAEGIGGATCHGLRDVDGVARAMADAFRAGRGRRVERRAAGLTSEDASAALARTLDALVATGPA